jgi:hypothetical protein
MLIATGVVVSLGAGCGDEQLDSGKAEDYVREQARIPDVIEDVTCPEDIDAQEGETFECRISLRDGAEEATRIRQLDDEGSIEIVGHRQTRLPRDTTNVKIIPENVEAYIRGNARDPERVLSVDCPADVPLQKGRTFSCVVRFLDRTTTRVKITQVDELGNVKLAR